MNYSKRAELFRQLRTKYAGFLASVLWKLTHDRELFTEAMQYALLGMWQNIEKLNGKKAGAYIYRIVLTANSKAWRDRIGKNGHFDKIQLDIQQSPDEKLGTSPLARARRGAPQGPSRLRLDQLFRRDWWSPRRRGGALWRSGATGLAVQHQPHPHRQPVNRTQNRQLT